MALPYSEVVNAIDVLRQVVPDLHGISFTESFEKENYEVASTSGLKKIDWPVNKLFGEGRKQDGWESIWVCIENITPDQLQLFEVLKNTVGNSGFTSERDDDTEGRNITMIGFF